MYRTEEEWFLDRGVKGGSVYNNNNNNCHFYFAMKHINSTRTHEDVGKYSKH